MADTDLLPSRGVTFEALVDSTGIAINGSSTVAQLASKGMRAACAVDGTGTAITGGANLVQLAAAGIRAFCAVDQNGVAQDASTADQLRARGIRPRVLLDATGVALNGSAGQAVLASRGLQSFCPVDESGNATTMGAVILISNTNVFDNIAVGATVGTLSVAGGSGTYTFTLPSNPGAHFATAGTNGVNLNTATALTAGSYPVTVQAAGGVPTPISRALSITVNQSPVIPANTALPVISGPILVGSTLTTTNGTWTGFPPPGFTYQWKRGGSAISGATGNIYLLVSADTGATITVTVTAINSAGNASATSAGVGPVTGPPITLSAGMGSFLLTGESMTPTTGYSMVAAMGAFGLAGQNANLIPPAPSYVGPGDLAGWSGTTTQLAYWGLRACKASYATPGTNPCIDIASSIGGSNPATIPIHTDGYLKLTGANSLGAWIASFGSTVFVSKIYDQVGTNHLLPGNVNWPHLVPSTIAGLPALTFDGSQHWFITTNNAAAQAAPIIATVVGQMNTGQTNGAYIGEGNFDVQVLISLGPGGISHEASSRADYTGNSYGAPHSLISIMAPAAGASSMCVDGATPQTGSVGAVAFPGGTKIAIGADTTNGTVLMTGFMYEAFILGGGTAPNAAAQAAMSTNQHSIGSHW